MRAVIGWRRTRYAAWRRGSRGTEARRSRSELDADEQRLRQPSVAVPPSLCQPWVEVDASLGKEGDLTQSNVGPAHRFLRIPRVCGRLSSLWRSLVGLADVCERCLALAPVLVAEAIDLAPVALGRPTLLLVDEGGGRHVELFGELRARGEALGGLRVQRGGDGGGSAAFGEAAGLDHVQVGTESKTHLVAGLEELGRLHALAV